MSVSSVPYAPEIHVRLVSPRSPQSPVCSVPAVPDGIRARLPYKPMQRQLKIIVEKHPDGYVAYPLGFKGVVVGDGNTYDEALADVKSAIQFHIETFGSEGLPGDSPVLEAFIAEATIPA